MERRFNNVSFPFSSHLNWTETNRNGNFFCPLLQEECGDHVMPLMGGCWLPSLANGTLGTLTSSMITCGVNGNTGETLQRRLTACVQGKEAQNHMLFTGIRTCMTLWHKQKFIRLRYILAVKKKAQYEVHSNDKFKIRVHQYHEPR